MSAIGTCPRCGEECAVRHRGDWPAEYLCPCLEAADAEQQHQLELADEAIAAVGEHAPDVWMAQAVAAVHELCRTRPRFTADDVWQRVGNPPEPRALGAVMRQVKREGVCEPTDQFVTSERRHGAPIRVWRSLGWVDDRTCDYCGATLRGKRPDARFCDDLHKAAWHRENAAA
jgi:hypothetical protein